MTHCPPCFEPMGRPPECIHQSRYMELEHFVVTRSITIEHPDYDWFSHKPADAFTFNYNRFIRISSVGYKHYGWDVMASCLIHELGHCDLFLEGIGEPEDKQEKIKVEQMANERGLAITPPLLVPDDYLKHREFFLRSYSDGEWSREKVLSEWRVFKQHL